MPPSTSESGLQGEGGAGGGCLPAGSGARACRPLRLRRRLQWPGMVPGSQPLRPAGRPCVLPLHLPCRCPGSTAAASQGPFSCQTSDECCSGRCACRPAVGGTTGAEPFDVEVGQWGAARDAAGCRAGVLSCKDVPAGLPPAPASCRRCPHTRAHSPPPPPAPAQVLGSKLPSGALLRQHVRPAEYGATLFRKVCCPA